MARDRNRLRDFQEGLAKRLRQAAELPQRQSRLAIQAGDRGYQTLINETLKHAIHAENIEKTIRNVIRQELKPYKV